MSQIFSPSYAQPSLPGNEPLVLVYDTTLGSRTIMAPFAGAIDIAIDWGDGIVEYYKSLAKFSSAPDLGYFQFYQHTYEVNGVYTVRVYGNADIIGPVSTIATVRLVANIRQELVRCLSFGNLGGNFGSIFYNCPNLVEVPDQLPSTVTSLGSAFRNCTSFNQDIGGWDTSNITSMSSVFHTTSFNQDISGWDTSNVGSFGGNSAGMFQNNTAFNQPIGTWNTSKASSMRSMFQGCTSFNQDIGGWDMSETGGTSSDLQNMFNGATSFNQDLKSWCMGAQLTQPSGLSTG
jgi:surface protein